MGRKIDYKLHAISELGQVAGMLEMLEIPKETKGLLQLKIQAAIHTVSAIKTRL